MFYKWHAYDSNPHFPQLPIPHTHSPPTLQPPLNVLLFLFSIDIHVSLFLLSHFTLPTHQDCTSADKQAFTGCLVPPSSTRTLCVYDEIIVKDNSQFTTSVDSSTDLFCIYTDNSMSTTPPSLCPPYLHFYLSLFFSFSVSLSLSHACPSLLL